MAGDLIITLATRLNGLHMPLTNQLLNEAAHKFNSESTGDTGTQPNESERHLKTPHDTLWAWLPFLGSDSNIPQRL